MKALVGRFQKKNPNMHAQIYSKPTYQKICICRLDKLWVIIYFITWAITRDPVLFCFFKKTVRSWDVLKMRFTLEKSDYYKTRALYPTRPIRDRDGGSQEQKNVYSE